MVLPPDCRPGVPRTNVHRRHVGTWSRQTFAAYYGTADVVVREVTHVRFRPPAQLHAGAPAEGVVARVADALLDHVLTCDAAARVAGRALPPDARALDLHVRIAGALYPRWTYPEACAMQARYREALGALED